MNLRLPNITSDTENGQLKQIKSYLIQMVKDLNYALSSISSGKEAQVVDIKGNPVDVSDKTNPESTFNAIKGLIIKSADIANAFFEEINKRLEGVYVAEATFPDGVAKFIQETASTMSANSTNIRALFENTQTIQSNIDNINSALVVGSDGTKILGTNAWLNVGVLEYDAATGFPIYGMELGQTNEENGVLVSRRFAQYRSDGVHLFDQNDTEVIELSSSRVIIKTKAEFKGDVTFGAFRIDTLRGFTVGYEGDE